MISQQISFCVTTFNRTDMVVEAIKDALIHPVVGEVIVVDDCSSPEVWEFLIHNIPNNVILIHNKENKGCYHNKKAAIDFAHYDWAVIADSDNLFDKHYFDRIENLIQTGLNPKTVYQPSFAKPHFNFSAFEGQQFNKNNAGAFASNDTFTTMLNAMNYFVNTLEYLKIWQDVPEPWTSDSLLHNYNWLAAGNSVYVVPGFEYGHRIHDGSHYREHVGKNGNLHDELIDKLRRL